MAKIIEFYIPSSFRKNAAKWIPSEEYGKVIPFVAPQRSQVEGVEASGSSALKAELSASMSMGTIVW